jgi:probable rRNA maturation factor
MILFDPDLGTDLDPDPAPRPAVRRKPVAAHSAPGSRTSRPPSARALAAFLRNAQAAVRLQGEVTVLLTSDAAIRRLNRQFRGKNKATDVLSFPTDPLQSTKPAEQVAGDLAISVPTARRQGAACGHSLAIELKVLILHGLLHLAGYDHESDSGQMARRERLLRGRLGLPTGLIERVSSPTLSPEKRRKDVARKSVRSRTGTKTREANAGPSTSAAKAAFAQDDRKKRARRREL